jgi:hypothetical protein
MHRSFKPKFPRGNFGLSQARFVLCAEGGVRIDDPKQLFCIRPAMEALADERPSLVLVVRTSRVV